MNCLKISTSTAFPWLAGAPGQEVLSHQHQDGSAIVQRRRDMTLQVVEDFRRRYASHYSLYNFTLQLNSILPGSFIVSFSVLESIIEILRVEEMLKAFGVTRLEIAGTCVYSDSEPGVCSRPRSMSVPVISHSTLTSAKDRELAQAQQQLREKVISEWCSVCCD